MTKKVKSNLESVNQDNIRIDNLITMSYEWTGTRCMLESRYLNELHFMHHIFLK